ncbi:hypothetical protein HKX48_000267 [Thoreauomyces humboldtii]|nr:hypothetical protein HKX48_000267 [Thoreauomyces humboldtii]
MSTLPPLHKLIPGTNFVVDGFQFRNPGLRYFLRITGEGSPNPGSIRSTAPKLQRDSSSMFWRSTRSQEVLVHVLEVARRSMDSPFDFGGGSTVTLMDANHCPGAAVLVFDVSTVDATYKIGKERMLKAISDAAGGDAGLPIYADPEQIAILKLLDLDFIELFTGAPGNTPIHVVSWGQLGKMAPGGTDLSNDHCRTRKLITCR